MNQQTANVMWNEKVGRDSYRMGLRCPHNGYDGAAPGQFVMVRSQRAFTPLLRRPFSISGLIDDDKQTTGIELLYRVLGKGTSHMARLTAGQPLDIIGPLGRGFKIKPTFQTIYLAAGGIGVAPIRFLARYLVGHGVSPDGIQLFLGGQNQEQLLCRDEFSALGIKIVTTTDDGSQGLQCLLTDPLEAAIARQAPDIVYACGPHGMLQCVEGIVKQYNVDCQISMETTMACGMGACLGCAVPAADPSAPYRHVCIEGPVFDIGQVDLANYDS